MIHPGDTYTDPITGVELIVEPERYKESCSGCFYKSKPGKCHKTMHIRPKCNGIIFVQKKLTEPIKSGVRCIPVTEPPNGPTGHGDICISDADPGL